MMYDHIDDYLMILLYNAAAMADCYYDEDDDGMCLCALQKPLLPFVTTGIMPCDHNHHVHQQKVELKKPEKQRHSYQWHGIVQSQTHDGCKHFMPNKV